VFNREGAIVAVELMAVVAVFDEAGRFHPTYDPGRIRTLGVDMVVLSIGQAPDRSWARGTSIRTDARGRIVADRDAHTTSHPRIFLAGESLRGPGSAIAAVADGHRVAEVVARFLETGQAVAPAPDDAKPLDPFPPDVVERLRTIRSTATEAKPFDEAEPSLAEPDAVAEADRCLGCLAGAVIDESKCAACLTCLRICPLDAVEIGAEIAANPARCQACGVCASHCPAEAIQLSYGGLAPASEALWDAAAAEAAAAKPVVVRCRHQRNGGDAGGERELTLPCLARLKPIELLRVFRQGARAVELRPCAQEQCKYGGAWANIEAVVGYVRSVLSKALPEARLDVCLPEDPSPPAQVPTGDAP
jgi:ferredoxin